MFLFIIPRTPIAYRNSLRDELWQISKKSLLAQTSTNWKAIVVGDTTGENLDPNFFITINFDNYQKLDKVKKALDYIENSDVEKPEYVIRFDDDDVFSDSILSDIESIPQKYDCYFDTYHTCIDAVYLKISFRKNHWIPNTAIHKYEHAIKVCGPSKEILLIQDHSAYWHIYYTSKSVFKTSLQNPLYFRILTPFSITSHNSSEAGNIDWKKHLDYLKGYGPWISLPQTFKYHNELAAVQKLFFVGRPKIGMAYWMFNKLKFFKNRLFN